MVKLFNRLGRSINDTSKVEHYGWNPDLGPVGEFKWLAKDLLVVDPCYQRDLRSKPAIVIAREFLWSKFGVINVNQRDGEESFFVMDGQHRVLAAQRREDIHELPCLVFRLDQVAAEARAFVGLNMQRKAAKFYEKWRAWVVAEDPDVLLCDGLIRSVGRVAADNTAHDTVACLGRILAAAKKERDTLVAIWPLISEVCHGESMPETIVGGLLWVERNLEFGVSLTEPKWRKRVISCGYGQIRSATEAARKGKGGTADRRWGLAILEVLNRRMKTRLCLSVDAAQRAMEGGYDNG